MEVLVVQHWHEWSFVKRETIVEIPGIRDLSLATHQVYIYICKYISQVQILICVYTIYQYIIPSLSHNIYIYACICVGSCLALLFFCPIKKSWDTLKLFSTEWIRKQHKNFAMLRLCRRCRGDVWSTNQEDFSSGRWMSQMFQGLWFSCGKASEAPEWPWTKCRHTQWRSGVLVIQRTSLKNLMYLVLKINSYAFSSIMCAYSNVLSASKRRCLS